MNFWISIFDAKCEVRERIYWIAWFYDVWRTRVFFFFLVWIALRSIVCVRKNVHIINNNNWKWFAQQNQKWKRCKTKQQPSEEQTNRDKKKHLENIKRNAKNDFKWFHSDPMIDNYVNYFNGSTGTTGTFQPIDKFLISILWI